MIVMGKLQNLQHMITLSSLDHHCWIEVPNRPNRPRLFTNEDRQTPESQHHLDTDENGTRDGMGYKAMVQPGKDTWIPLLMEHTGI